MADLYRVEYTQVHMGVQARMVLFAEDSAAAEVGARAAFDRIAELDAKLSDYRPDSELSKLAQAPIGERVRVSEDLFQVLEVAQRLARQSRGAFDVTVGPLVRLWREARRTGGLPTPRALEEAKARSGFELLELDRRDTTAALRAGGMSLDLGGIAKGFAVDEALAVLRCHDLPHVLIEFGGDIAAGEPPPGRQGWFVMPPGGGRRIVLARAAISTSGDTEQFVVVDGRRYSHVVDPRSGIGLTDRIGVTVIAPNATLSDALATSLSVLEPEAGRRLLAQYPDVEATFRYADD
jgi:thiamine biosynthesis lipoprotein